MPRLNIDTDYLRDVLAGLLKIPSPTGYTDVIVRQVSRELNNIGVPFELTRRGAIRATLKGKSLLGARAILSHLDTIGAQVKRLKDNGRLEIVPIGCWSARFAEGARVTIFSEAGTYSGTILPLKASGHTYADEIDSAPIGWEHVEVRVDALSRSADELAKLGIEIGDIIAIDPHPEFLDNGYIVSRHLDNKAGVALMLAALRAMREAKVELELDAHWVFTIAEEVGTGAASVLTNDIASMVAVDNGTSAPGQNSSEFGVTIAMADQSGPYDYHLTKKLVRLCQENEIPYQKDIFRHYRSDSASALEAGHDVRTALITFGVDASHGYERIHMHSLRSVAELVTAYLSSPVEIGRDAHETGSLAGFTTQPMVEAEAEVEMPNGPSSETSSS